MKVTGFGSDYANLVTESSLIGVDIGPNKLDRLNREAPPINAPELETIEPRLNTVQKP